MNPSRARLLKSEGRRMKAEEKPFAFRLLTSAFPLGVRVRTPPLPPMGEGAGVRVRTPPSPYLWERGRGEGQNSPSPSYGRGGGVRVRTPPLPSMGEGQGVRVRTPPLPPMGEGQGVRVKPAFRLLPFPWGEGQTPPRVALSPCKLCRQHGVVTVPEGFAAKAAQAEGGLL